MKSDEPFNPNIKSLTTSEDILFKLADETHVESICDLMFERNPLMNLEDLKKKTEREIYLNENDPEYRLFVALIENEVVGLCRFYHSKGLPKEKIKFESPNGWYAMGTLVAKQHRRKSIARFLFQERLKVLKSLNATTLYSIVDVSNKTSIQMHQEFGFLESGRAKGYLHLDFQDSEAILFRFDIE
jgi:GNAT superfamily N-acetyltransferase